MFKALSDVTTDHYKPTDVDRVTWYVMGPGLTGTKGNYWTSGDDFPKFTKTAWYLTSGKMLSSALTDSNGAISFAYNPNNPVKTVGGNNLLMDCGMWDQSLLEKRADVITFTSPPLDNDYAVTGRLTAIVYVSSNATDTDFTLKVGMDGFISM